MEIISRDFTDKPVRHTFDRKAFRKYSTGLLVSPFIVLMLQALPLMTSRDDTLDIFMIAFKVGLPALFFTVPLFSFLTMLFTLRSSDVFTAPGCVLYRKRRLYTSQLDGICYIVYHISNVKSVTYKEKSAVSVKGDINAVYVLDDGKTIRGYKTCRKISIPPCFTDMDIIRMTLGDMEADPEVSNGEYISY